MEDKEFSSVLEDSTVVGTWHHTFVRNDRKARVNPCVNDGLGNDNDVSLSVHRWYQKYESDGDIESRWSLCEWWGVGSGVFRIPVLSTHFAVNQVFIPEVHIKLLISKKTLGMYF